MNRNHIIGRKNSGKTTLIVDLVEYLTRRGLRVGTIKHTHHHHELDTPGKDSFRHRQAGAQAVGILSPQMNAVFWPQEGTEDLDSTRDRRYEYFQSLMKECDLLLVEGDSSTSALKIEVWRAESQSIPIYEHDPSVTAVITDDELSVDIPVLPRSDVPRLVQWLSTRPEIELPALREQMQKSELEFPPYSKGG